MFYALVSIDGNGDRVCHLDDYHRLSTGRISIGRYNTAVEARGAIEEYRNKKDN